MADVVLILIYVFILPSNCIFSQNMSSSVNLPQILVHAILYSRSFNNIHCKVTIQKVFDVNVIGEVKVKDHAIFIEEGILQPNSSFRCCNFMFNMFYGSPMESTVSTLIQL